MSTPQPPVPQAAPPAWQQATGSPYPTYTSPIPIVRTHLGHAIASEWTKIKSVRSTLWTLGVFVVLVIGIGVLTAAIVADATSGESDYGDGTALALGFFGLLLGSMCIMTLGVLTTASEYGTGMIRTTATACPTRVRVLAAKSIVFFTVAFVVTLAATSIVAVLQVGLVDVAQAPTASEWLKGTFGVSLYIALLGLLSLLVGSIVRHSAGAITIMIGAVLAPLVIALFMATSSLEKVRTALFEYSIPSQLSVFYSSGSLGNSGGPSGWDPLWIMLGVTAAAFAGAWALLEKRDV